MLGQEDCIFYSASLMVSEYLFQIGGGAFLELRKVIRTPCTFLVQIEDGRAEVAVVTASGQSEMKM